MPGIVIPIAIVQLDVVGVVSDDSTILANFIQGMGPSIGELRAHPVPFPDLESALQSVVVRRTDAIELKDIAEILKVDTARVDVRNDIQLASLAANITYLKDSRIPQGLFDLQVEIV